MSWMTCGCIRTAAASPCAPRWPSPCSQPGPVTLGNGSNDTLALLAEAFLGPGAKRYFPAMRLRFIPIVTQATGATAREAEALPAGHAQALGHDLAAMLAPVEPGHPGGVHRQPE